MGKKMTLSGKKHTKSFIVALCAFVYFVSYFSRKDFAAVLVAMTKEGSGVITETVGGAIGTGLFICYGIGQLVSGFLGDRIKPSHLMLSGLSATALCNLLMPLTSNGYLMIAIWAVNGFAQAMLWPPIVRILADNLDHERFVMANLVVTTAAHISTVILYIYTPLVCLKFYDYKAVFFTAAILAAVAAAVLIISLIIIIPKDAIKKPIKKIPTLEKDQSASYGALVRRAGIIPIFVCIVMMGILRDGIETWLPTLYSAAFNRNADESILLSVALPIFSIISIVLIKLLYKTRSFKNEARGTMILFAAVIAVTVPIFLLITSSTLLPRLLCLILACLVCACMHGVNFLLISCLPGRFSRYGRAATTSGFCNAFTYVGAAISSYGFAVISKYFGWRMTTLSWMGVGAVGIIFALIAYNAYTKFIEENEQ